MKEQKRLYFVSLSNHYLGQNEVHREDCYVLTEGNIIDVLQSLNGDRDNVRITIHKAELAGSTNPSLDGTIKLVV